MDLLEHVEDGVATLTLNRPERLNALTRDMLSALSDAIPRLEENDDVGAIILTGAGRAFSSGGDVKKMAEGGEADQSLETRQLWLRRRMEVSRLIHECRKPVIAMVRGPCAGAGLSIALAADMRIASPTARFITAFAKVGLSGDFGGTWFLSRLIGTGRARELYFTGGELDAATAERLGVANRIVPDDQLESETVAFARSLANGPRVAIAYMKKNLNVAAAGTLAESLDIESMHHVRSGYTEDHREAAAAFAEKRRPTFRGR